MTRKYGADDYTPPPDALPLFGGPLEGRERAEAIHEPARADVLEALRNEALSIWRKTGRAVSANDIRPLLTAMGYRGDLRVLGAVFNRKEWKPVGRISTETERRAEFGATRQTILTYVPRMEQEEKSA